MLYIASPLGFTEPGRLWQEQVLLPRLAGLDCRLYDPWKVPNDARAILDEALATPPSQERSALLYKFNRLRGAQNVQALDKSAGMLAILDGVDLDSGTVAEVGYMSAQAKPVIGLRTDFRFASDNEADPINLQVVYFVEASGGRLVHTLDEAVSLIDDLIVAA
jgi:nucleoside 2-deoxyribosyltransferase